jgi:phosphocarrier protein
MSKSTMSQHLFQDLVIVNELGLHARSAAKLAKLAQQAHGGVWLEKDDERVDAKQVIDILTLAAAKGDQVRITIDHSRDRETLDLITLLIKDGFGE